MVILWDIKNPKPLRSFKGHIRGTGVLAVSSDGKRVVSIGGGTTPVNAVVWDLETAIAIAEHPALGSSGRRVFFLPGDRTIALDDHERIHFWDYETNRERSLDLLVQCIDFSPDGWLFAAATETSTQLIETLTGKIVWQMPMQLPLYSWNCLAFAPDARSIAVAQGNGKVLILDWALDKVSHSFQASDYGPFGMSFSPDGKRLAGTDRTSALIWDVASVVNRPLPGVSKPDPTAIDAWCEELGSADARTGYRAAWKLIGAGDDAVAKIKARLKPLPTPTANELASWIRNLDSAQFAVRDKAHKTLVRFGHDVLPAVEKALKNTGSLEQRRRLQEVASEMRKDTVPLQKLEEVRALFVLEQLRTPAARDVLQWLGHADSQSFLPQQARLALTRWNKQGHTR